MDGEEGEEEEDEDDDDEDDEPDDSAKAMLRHKDDEYVPIDGERRKIGDDNPGDDEDEPTDVQGWRKLAESPSFLCGGMALRSYQLDGLNWLRLSYYLGRNVILGDEMGLGKTAQSITLTLTLTPSPTPTRTPTLTLTLTPLRQDRAVRLHAAVPPLTRGHRW